ncbi:MAG: HAMP domain-containing protein [Anaerolineaceae bacterium]|nr:MAG: HAMP domain-containing protein [Anaerolineaceae bacterium]
MSIRTRLFFAFLILTVFPLVFIGYNGMRSIEHVSELTVTESTQQMKELGQTSIRQKAIDVAMQAQLYFEAHPELLFDSTQMMADKELAGIAVQPVGMTGYTALYDSKGITYFHSNPKLVGQDMHMFAATLPEFWAIFDASLDGTVVGSYYVWKEPNGSLREKYMECVPVGSTQFRIAATTYMDEFYVPIRDTEQKARSIFEQTRLQTYGALTAVTGLSLLVALWLSSYISRPVASLVSASQAVEAGDFSSVNLREVEKRKDELGGLARVFSRMAEQMRSREQDLKDEVQSLQTKVQLFIEIDLARKEGQVREITESEYFENLSSRVRDLRTRKEQGE